MNETHAAVKEILQKQRAKQARRMVSDQLVSYHRALMASLELDSEAFLQRVTARIGDGIERRQMPETPRAH
jgi:hypothetical protein